MPKILCLSYFQAKPGCKDALVDALLQLIKPTLEEPGCIDYEVFADTTDPDFFIVSETFIDQDALDTHEKQPYVVAFMEGPMMQYSKTPTWHVARKIILGACPK